MAASAKEVGKASIELTVEDIESFVNNPGNSVTSTSVSAGGIQWQLRVETSAADDGKTKLALSLQGVHENGAWSRWLTADFFVSSYGRSWRNVGRVCEKMVGSAPPTTSADCGKRLRDTAEHLVDWWHFARKFRVDFACWKDSFQEKRDFDDVKFVVEGRPVYANKDYISYISRVLRARLAGHFKEAQSDEVPITQTSAEDFVTFMRAVAAFRDPVTDANVQKLYGLADVFDAEFLRLDCEKHLMTTKGIKTIDKLLLTQSLKKTDFIVSGVES